MSERIVEYPWVLENLELKEGNILDAGCCGSRLAKELSKNYKVWGIDLEPCSAVNGFIFIRGDIRKTNLPDNFFDRIISVSTIEHVGIIGENNIDDDFKAMEELRRILKPDGFVLITIPYGKMFFIGNQFRIYDKKRLSKLFESFKIIKKDFFKNMDYPTSPSDNWTKANEEDATDSKDVNMIACVKAMK